MGNIIGLDMSTLSSGYAVFDSNKKLVKYGIWKQDKKLLWRDRCINMGKELSKLIETYSPSMIYCEDTILSGECGSNVQTIKMLSVLQGIVLGVCNVHKVKVKFLMPSAWRKDLGVYDGTREGTKRPQMKYKTIEKVNEIYNLTLYYDIEKPKTVKNQDDIGDAVGIVHSQLFPIKQENILKKAKIGRKANIK